MAAAAAGGCLASGSADGVVRLWNGALPFFQALCKHAQSVVSSSFQAFLLRGWREHATGTGLTVAVP